MRLTGKGLLLAAALAFFLIGAVFLNGWTGSGPLNSDKNIMVKSGDGLRSVARQMEEEGIISSADGFVLRARILGEGGTVKAGEFRIPAHASNAEIYRILTRGRPTQRLLTVVEGMPSIMVFDRIMANPMLEGAIEVPAEGSVLPDSYAYEKGEARSALLARMQDAMRKALAEEWAGRSSDIMVKTPQEAVILASIVEKETQIASERAMVAGVYSNRLRIGMRLQADPTIIYPITKGKPLGRRILRSEINAVNEYNTYSMAGLPKGPIANPSRAAIHAVLHPEKTGAIYFVADGRGGHIFADTLAEHEANVRKWFALRRARGEIK